MRHTVTHEGKNNGREDCRKHLLKKTPGRKQGTKLKGTDHEMELINKLREDGISYSMIGMAMNISRQRAFQLVQM